MEHVIVLTYVAQTETSAGAITHSEIYSKSPGGGPNKYEVHASKAEPSETKPRNVGDTMSFKSNSGYITVELPPEEFEPRWFSTDPYFCQQNNLTVGAPVKIIKELPNEFKYWCGFSFGYPGDFKLGVQDGGH
jgi:hypothetical protein